MRRWWAAGVILTLALTGCVGGEKEWVDKPKDPRPVDPTELVDPEIGVERTAQLLELCQAQADTAPPLTKAIADEVAATKTLYMCSLQSPNPEAGPPRVSLIRYQDLDPRQWQAFTTDQPLPEGCWDAKTEQYWWPTYLTDGTTVWKTREIFCDFMQETP